MSKPSARAPNVPLELPVALTVDPKLALAAIGSLKDDLDEPPNDATYNGCMANCLRVKYTASDGAVGKFMCQSRFFYMALSWAYYGEENDAAFRANRLCDELGVAVSVAVRVAERRLRRLVPPPGASGK